MRIKEYAICDLSGVAQKLIIYLLFGRLGSYAQHKWLFDSVVLGIATQPTGYRFLRYIG